MPYVIFKHPCAESAQVIDFAPEDTWKTVLERLSMNPPFPDWYIEELMCGAYPFEYNRVKLKFPKQLYEKVGTILKEGDTIRLPNYLSRIRLDPLGLPQNYHFEHSTLIKCYAVSSDDTEQLSRRFIFKSEEQQSKQAFYLVKGDIKNLEEAREFVKLHPNYYVDEIILKIPGSKDDRPGNSFQFRLFTKASQGFSLIRCILREGSEYKLKKRMRWDGENLVEVSLIAEGKKTLRATITDPPVLASQNIPKITLYLTPQGNLEYLAVMQPFGRDEKAREDLDNFLKNNSTEEALQCLKTNSSTLRLSNGSTVPIRQCIEGFRFGRRIGEFRVGSKEDRIKKLENLDVMLERFYKIKKIMSISDFEKKYEKILTRFTSSPLTEKKRKVFENFKTFYEDHPELRTKRTQLIEKWAEEYQEKEKTNPFALLSAHRRTLLLVFFKIPITIGTSDSIKLFKKFLGKESLPPSLEATLNNQTKIQPNF